MQRQRGELVPIGEAFSGLDAGPLQAIRWASDRIGEQGVIALVTNGSWIGGNVDSGAGKMEIPVKSREMGPSP